MIKTRMARCTLRLACILDFKLAPSSSRHFLAMTAAFCLTLAQHAAQAQSASALYLNQTPAPAGTAPGTALFSGHAGQAGVTGTPTANGTWLVGSAFGQPVGSDLFWND
jgi:hypothetical protein